MAEISHLSDHMQDRVFFGLGADGTPLPTDEEIERLKKMGRRFGHVTLDQVKSVLPVEQMSSEEIGRAMARLESAGIEVEIDPEFLRSRTDRRSAEKLRLRQASLSKPQFGAIEPTTPSNPMSNATGNSQPVPCASAVTPRSWGGTLVTGLIVLIVTMAIIFAVLTCAPYWR